MDKVERRADLVILDPVVRETPRAGGRMAPRLATLEGATVGLLENTKPKARELLGLVYDELARRHRPRGSTPRSSGNASRPAPAAVLDEMAQACDVVIVGLGD